MLQVSAIITNQRQADAWAEFQKAYLDEPKVVTALKEAVKHAKGEVAARVTTVQAEKPTPLEQAIDAAVKEGEENDKAQEDPFAALSAGVTPAAETQPETVDKPKRTRSKKEPTPATESEKAEDKPLTLDDIRKASTIALELVGAVVIQEALAKFNAVDDKNVLRMSSLRTQDYELYVGYLKKKVNDAAKEWPANG